MTRKALMIGGFLIGISISLVTNTASAEVKYTQAEMDKVSIRFCNQEGEMKHDDLVVVEPGQEKSVRLCAQNAGENPVEFTRGYAVGEYNGVGSHVCGGDMGPNNRFSILIPETKERKLIIGGMSTEVIEEKIVVPPGMSGLQMGCLIYKLAVPDLISLGSIFNIELRKYGYFDIMIGGESTIKNKIEILDATGGVISTNKKIKATIDNDNNMNISFSVENQGNISHMISMTGRISNMLGFMKDLNISPKVIAPGAIEEFKVNVGIIPSYKGLYDIDMSITNEPQFLFPISDEKLKQPGHYQEKGKIFVFSWILVAIVVVIVFILYRTIRRRKPASAQV